MTNVSKFDGLPVEAYAGRFSGSFEIDPEVGENLAYDDVVTFVVVGVVGKVAMGSNKSGEIKRSNTFEVTNVNILPQELAYQVYNMVNTGEVAVSPEVAVVSKPDTGEWWDEMMAEHEGDEMWSAPTDDAPNVVAAVVPGGPVRDPQLKDFLYGDGDF